MSFHIQASDRYICHGCVQVGHGRNAAGDEVPDDLGEKTY
jgi:hypothetical protein